LAGSSRLFTLVGDPFASAASWTISDHDDETTNRTRKGRNAASKSSGACNCRIETDDVSVQHYNVCCVLQYDGFSGFRSASLNPRNVASISLRHSKYSDKRQLVLYCTYITLHDMTRLGSRDDISGGERTRRSDCARYYRVPPARFITCALYPSWAHTAVLTVDEHTTNIVYARNTNRHTRHHARAPPAAPRVSGVPYSCLHMAQAKRSCPSKADKPSGEAATRGK
jgi:hypothetical protein